MRLGIEAASLSFPSPYIFPPASPYIFAIVKDWQDKELAVVLANMDSGKASELLGAMEPKRASKISQELQILNSRVPIPE